MTNKINKFIAQNDPETPCLIIDLDVIEHNYFKLKYFFPKADIFYAIKANPGTEVLQKLEDIGSNFDCASINEIKMCLSVNTPPDKISYGNTIKKEKDIKEAYELGVRLFAFDSIEELEKIAKNAPDSKVFCRILVEGSETAEWPLSKKFGCETEMAVDLLVKSANMNLQPYGVSFHVGSQQIDISTWRKALSEVAGIFSMCEREGVTLSMINMGGGFPAKYKNPVESLENYTTQIEEFIIENFGEESEWPRIIIEPGRSLSGDAGIILSEVVLVSKKNYSEYEPRWVYIDVGKFGGLAETIDESIKYRIQTLKDNSETGPVILAGPSCDSQDVLFSNYQYELPLDLKSGDKIKILSCGSYTNTYASGNMMFKDKIIGFNGFETLKVYYI